MPAEAQERAGRPESGDTRRDGHEPGSGSDGRQDRSYELPDPLELSWGEVGRVEDLVGVPFERWEAELGRARYARAVLDATGQLSWSESEQLRPADVLARIAKRSPAPGG